MKRISQTAREKLHRLGNKICRAQMPFPVPFTENVKKKKYTIQPPTSMHDMEWIADKQITVYIENTYIQGQTQMKWIFI